MIRRIPLDERGIREKQNLPRLFPSYRWAVLRPHSRSGGRVYKENNDYWVNSVAYPTRAEAAQGVWRGK